MINKGTGKLKWERDMPLVAVWGQTEDFFRFSSKTLMMGLLPEKYLVPIEKMIDDGKIQLDFYDILGEMAKLP